MQHLVASTTEVDGVHHGRIVLPVPPPKKPYFGLAFTPEGEQRWRTFYAAVAVLAYPSPATAARIVNSDDKALYYRAPYSSVPGVVEHYPPMETAAVPTTAIITRQDIVDLTDKLLPDGTLQWVPPPGKWTIMRFGARNNGAATRPAPLPGVGFEADKFDTTALNAHLNAFTSKLLPTIGEPKWQRAA